MSRHQLAPTEALHAQPGRWLLSVVRGTKLGHAYAVAAGETIVGNAVEGGRGLDLTEQEVGASRRMAARHAAITSAGQDLTIRDLESPGGTFVNRQRLLSGQSRRLEPGDVIQLGGVQLEVKRKETAAAANPPTAPAPMGPTRTGAASPARAAQPGPEESSVAPRGNASPPGAAVSSVASRGRASPGAQQPTTENRLPTPFTITGGAQCRTWDDFLIHAAQDWRVLREELASGRIADYLARIGRADLKPRTLAGGSPDEQLDDWLARVPATQSSAPELDVHPETLLVKAATGGGIVRQTIRVTNVGYRLLKCTAKVEPSATPWLRLSDQQDGRPFPTIDQTDLAVELELPETIDRPLTAAVVIESNGGTRRVAVRIERPAASVVASQVQPGSAGLVLPVLTDHLKRRLGRLSWGARLGALCGGLVALRLVAMFASVLPFGTPTAHALEPRLAKVAIVLAGAGALAGCALARRRGDDRRDLAAHGVTGATFGILVAGVWFAIIQSVERALGSWSTSIWAVGLCWGFIGALVAAISMFLIPHRSGGPEARP
jgi:hypothetical protein